MNYLFTIGLAAIIRWHTASFYYVQQWRDWMESMLAGAAQVRADLLLYRKEKEWLLQFNGTKIYLERYLNDLFDPLIRGIYIEKIAPIQPQYRYNKAENRTRYKYNKWNSDVEYAAGEYARDGAYIYRALVTNYDTQPSTSVGEWEVFSDARYLRNKSEKGNELKYRVIIPVHMTLTNSLRLKVTDAVNVFNLVGVKYEIKKIS